jgi:hypothetical protein
MRRLVALELHHCDMRGSGVDVAAPSITQARESAGRVTGDVEAGLDGATRRAASAYAALEERLAGEGGVARVAELYDRLRAGMNLLDYAELDRVAAEIRSAIEMLLEMDAAVRKLNNLKVLFDKERRGHRSDERETGS